MKNKFYLFVIAMFSLSICEAQKLKSDNWEVSIQKWSKSEKGMFGESNIIYSGAVEMYKGKAKLKSHLFEYNETTGSLVIKTLKKQVKEPKLKYNDEDESFTYTNESGEEVNQKALKAGKPKLVVLSGVLVWLNYKP